MNVNVILTAIKNAQFQTDLHYTKSVIEIL